MMITEQLFLTKWQSLESDKKAQVLALIDNLSKDNAEDNNKLVNYKPKTRSTV